MLFDEQFPMNVSDFAGNVNLWMGKNSLVQASNTKPTLPIGSLPNLPVTGQSVSVLNRSAVTVLQAGANAAQITGWVDVKPGEVLTLTYNGATWDASVVKAPANDLGAYWATDTDSLMFKETVEHDAWPPFDPAHNYQAGERCTNDGARWVCWYPLPAGIRPSAPRRVMSSWYNFIPVEGGSLADFLANIAMQSYGIWSMFNSDQPNQFYPGADSSGNFGNAAFPDWYDPTRQYGAGQIVFDTKTLSAWRTKMTDRNRTTAGSLPSDRNTPSAEWERLSFFNENAPENWWTLPHPVAADAGKVPTVNATGDGYELAAGGGGGMKAVQLTAAAYAALATKDPNTLYVIQG
jgi:hypothetical protein